MTSRDDIRELIALHSLNALDPDERAIVDSAVDRDAELSAELDAFRVVAGALAESVVPPDAAPSPAVWEGILASIEQTRAGATVVPLRPKRNRWLGVTSAVAVAAVFVAIGLAVRIGSLEQQIDETGIDQLAAAKMTEPGSLVVTLDAAEGHDGAAATAVLGADGAGFIVSDSLPPLPTDRTYQLWAVFAGDTEPRVISAGVLGTDPATTPFQAVGDIVGLAITEEVAGGVPVSEGDTVAVWLRDA